MVPGMADIDDLDLDALDFGSVEPKEFARIVKELPVRRIAELMSGPQRGRVLDEVFNRMETLFKPDAAGKRDALIRWRITNGDDGRDVYETHIAGGACKVTRQDSGREPQLTLTMAAPEFLKLVSGNASGPTLFFTRKLKIQGDIRLAGGLTYFFDIPKA